MTQEHREIGGREGLKTALNKLYKDYVDAGGKTFTPVDENRCRLDGETMENRELRFKKMQVCLENPMKLDELLPQESRAAMAKSSISMSSNIYGYDLYAPSLHLIPFLSPIRNATGRVQRANPGDAAHWKSITSSTFNTGGFPADPWINEGSRAPLMSVSATNNTATYVTIGIDGSDTFEAQNAGMGFEDPQATARFLALEALMVKEEDALIGGNKTLKLGTANTPTNTTASPTSPFAGLTGTYYVGVVGLTYSGYRNQTVSAGLIAQKTITTPDAKTMTVNGGVGQRSAVSSSVAPSGQAIVSTVTPKAGEFAWAWYVGLTGSSTMYLQSITTIPTATFGATAALTTSTQTFSNAPAADYSVNDGTTGGQPDQVTAFDGFLVQALNASQLATPNAYYRNLAGATLTASGRGSVSEIDTAFRYAWDNYRISYSKIYVNAQELINITTACLSNASGPLVRYELAADGDHYDLTASGTIAYYYNPFVNGGSKIPVIVHPTIPPGTIFLQGETLPPYFKKSNMSQVAEVLCRKDYYSIDFARRTREYEFGTYSEEVLAVYAPFCLGVISGIKDGVGGL